MTADRLQLAVIAGSVRALTDTFGLQLSAAETARLTEVTADATAAAMPRELSGGQ